jgi:hypothetical protein
MHAIDSILRSAWYEMPYEHALYANFQQVRGRDGARLKALVGKASGRADAATVDDPTIGAICLFLY